VFCEDIQISSKQKRNLPTQDLTKTCKIFSTPINFKSLIPKLKFANITILNPNQKAFRTEPYDYIRRFNISDELLEQQYIPTEDESLWKVENYREFLNRRTKLMVDGINRFLASLKT